MLDDMMVKVVDMVEEEVIAMKGKITMEVSNMRRKSLKSSMQIVMQYAGVDIGQGDREQGGGWSERYFGGRGHHWEGGRHQGGQQHDKKNSIILACFAHALDLPGDLHPLLVVDGEVPILQLLVNQV